MSVLSQDQVPLLLGGGVLAIVLVAFFTSRDSGDKAASSSPPSEPARAKKKKNKKKGNKGSGKSNGSAPASAAEEEPSAPADPAPSAAKKKKKKKKKKKPAPADAADRGDIEKKVSFAGDEDSDDDDFDLTAIQSSAVQRRGASDVAVRAAANKERARQRALEQQQEKEKERAASAVAEAAAAEAVEAAAVAAEAERLRLEDAAAAAAAAKAEELRAEEGRGAQEEAAPTKKKRKRKKKRGAGLVTEEPVPVVAPPPPAPRAVPVQAASSGDEDEERWEQPPPEEEAWLEVGSKKAKQKAKLDAQADVGPAVDDDGNFVSSDGPTEVEDNETSATMPAGDDPLVLIGRGGSTIQNLQDSTGARFHLDRQTNVLTISGPESCVELGLAEARALLAAEAARKESEVSESVTWGPDAIKAVIGRGGMTIRAAQDETGTRINADVEAGTLVVEGPADAVAAALTLCHHAAFGEVQDRLELGSRNAVNVVFGPGFSTVRALQDETDCRLDVDRGTTTLKLSGSAEAVAAAAERVRALLEENRGFEMTIENSKVGAVYGRAGETLRSVQDRTGTHIDVSRGPTHATVSVMGPADAAARARGMLQRAIDGEVDLKPGEVAEEVELGSGTAAVIGRGGSNVTDLESRHGVKVNVRSELQTAKVVGQPDAVAAAVKEIEGIVAPIREAEKAQIEANKDLASGESAWQVTDDDDDADGW